MATSVDALDLLPDGVVVADAGGAVTAINAVAARMLGVEQPGALGHPLAEVLALTDHDAQAWTAANAPYDGLRTRSGVPEQSWLLPDGTEVLVTARLHRAARNGPVESVAISLRAGRGRARLDRDRSDLVATLAHEPALAADRCEGLRARPAQPLGQGSTTSRRSSCSPLREPMPTGSAG
ncbi:PAS domain-containing protein [Nocardioides convexus]|uniref:PAS domain-containing protein n=1 Tax=Nocardioides convexus TaxID=2712224 RepID=UPI002418A011|nr:PAS domain-containing protein [Nocardioides convexus]